MPFSVRHRTNARLTSPTVRAIVGCRRQPINPRSSACIRRAFSLVLYPGNNYGCRASQKIQVKAQSAGNGRCLFKDCNAGLDPLGRSLRASRDRASGECSQPKERAVALGCKRPGTSWEVVVRGVAPLGKGEGHSRRGAPCAQPLPNSLHP